VVPSQKADGGPAPLLGSFNPVGVAGGSDGEIILRLAR
jgi:hypothetical protein